MEVLISKARLWLWNRVAMGQTRLFLSTIFPIQFNTIISALNFPNFKLQLINQISEQLKSEDFWTPELRVFIPKFPTTSIAHNSLIRAPRRLLRSFFEFGCFWCFWMENHIFDVRKKSSAVLCIFVQYFFTSNYHYNIGLKIPKFQTSIDHNFWSKSRWQLLLPYLLQAHQAC